MDVLVIGAGMAGIRAATLRAADGDRVEVVDKGRRHGGRLATRRVDDALFDTGAIDVAAHGPELTTALTRWAEDGAVTRTSGRWRGHPTARALPEALAARSGAEVRLATTVIGLAVHDGRWHATLRVGEATRTTAADGLVITAPAPQTAALLRSGDRLASGSTLAALDAVRYAPSLTVLVRSSDRTLTWDDVQCVSPDRRTAPHITRLHRNEASGGATVVALTLQGSASWSAANLDGDRDAAADELAAQASRLIGTALDVVHIHAWRYAQVTHGIDLPALRDDTAGAPLVLAGDLFERHGDGPPDRRLEGVERAFLSGTAAARLLDGR